MAFPQSKLTAQGQISIPAEIRRKLGVGPGSVLEWEEEAEGKIVVRRAGRFSSEDVHRELFEQPPQPRTLDELKDSIRQHVRGKHAGR